MSRRQYFPSQWQTIETQLVGLQGEERDIKLLQIMEQMQEQDAATMTAIRQKMN